MAEEFEINGHTYRAKRMPVLTKFHVARRMGPVLVGFMKANTSADEAGVATFAGIAEALAAMSQEDADYVLNECLDYAEINQDGRWFPVARSGQLMYAFIDLPEMMRVVMGVLTENVMGFFPSLTSSSIGAAPTSPASMPSVSPAT